MGFRVTQSMIAANSLANLQNSLTRSQQLQDQMSTGKILRKPSDDPTGAARSLQLRSEITRNQQWSTNADDGLGWLGTADKTLTSSLDSISKVRDLVLQGANATTDPEGRKALALEVRAVRDGLIGLANTSYNNRPIFAGNTDTNAAFAQDGSYLGDSGTVYRTVGTDASVQVNVVGTDVFGSGNSSLFKVLDDIATHLENGTDADIAALTNASGGVAGDLDRLDSARLTMQNRLSEVGARYHRVETMQLRAQDDLITLKSNLSHTEDADLPATFVALSVQNTAYQAALAATSKVIQPSLVDFLR